MQQEYPRRLGQGASPYFSTTRITSLNNIYSYSNLRTITFTEGIRDKLYPYQAYYARLKDAFIYLKRQGCEVDEGYGWKFHISVDDENFKNVEKAWDILKDILIKHKITLTKVVRPDLQLSIKAPTQRGKQITIYQFLDPTAKWEQIISEITTEFTRHNIAPGYAPISDHPLGGTPFVYYRTDADEEGKPLEGGRDAPGRRNEIFDKYEIILLTTEHEKLVVADAKPWNEQPIFKMK